MANKGLAQDLFEDMGRKVEAASSVGVEDGEAKLVEEIQSLCMNCHEDGMTKLLLTRIPFFREIIIMSFDCPHCNFRNSEVQPAGQIQQQGHQFIFKVNNRDDLNRQLVKSDTCKLHIAELDLEIPPGRGQLTNIEGILSMVAQDLEQKQSERKEVIPDVYVKIQSIIESLREMASGEQSVFTITLDDPAGNSWIEPSPQDARGTFKRINYDRTAEQNAALGLGATQEATEGDSTHPPVDIRPEYHATQMVPELPDRPMVANVDEDIVENQVYTFPATCPGCTNACATNMKMVNIPHFKQVVLMSTVCDHCGYRSTEVKTGGEVPEKGRRITLAVENVEDLSRDILKSESCAMSCPELELSVEPGTLGGRFTTVEGLLSQVRDDLKASIFDVNDTTGQGGDSMASEEKSRWQTFFDKLDSAIKGDTKFHIVLEDPLASSYVQSFTAPEPDGQMSVEEYERTEEEEDDLGLRDMKTEGYEHNQENGVSSNEEERARRFLDTVVK